nr:hypothetical protein [uncultured Treponema sp.]
MGVEYYMHIFYAWIGTDLIIISEIYGSRNQDILFGLRISPFTYTYSMDHHLTKNKQRLSSEMQYMCTRIKESEACFKRGYKTTKLKPTSAVAKITLK